MTGITPAQAGDVLRLFASLPAGTRTTGQPRSTTRETCAASGCPVCQSQINSGKRGE